VIGCFLDTTPSFWPEHQVRNHYDQILKSLVNCSERVRLAVINANHATISEAVGMGADGAVTSRIDHVAEEAALDWFTQTDPIGNVLSEEIGFVDRGSALTFVLDPIDSTSNATVAAPLPDAPPLAVTDHVRTIDLPHNSQMVGFPYFAFSVAAMVDGKLVAACVRNLPTGDTFTAVVAQGARVNDVPVQTTGVHRLRDAWVALIRPSGNEGLRRVSEILVGAKRVRITGCSALDIALIASGGVHALVNPNAHRPPHSGEKVVDYAGAQLILQEAGGVISDTEGNPLPIDHNLSRLTPVLAAATRQLHEDLIRSIHPSENS
jgi:myo-inositol-1(or 4)-monophosphatase